MEFSDLLPVVPGASQTFMVSEVIRSRSRDASGESALSDSSENVSFLCVLCASNEPFVSDISLCSMRFAIIRRGEPACAKPLRRRQVGGEDQCIENCKKTC